MRVIGNQQEQKVSVILNHPPYKIISKINIVFLLLMRNIYFKNNEVVQFYFSVVPVSLLHVFIGSG